MSFTVYNFKLFLQIKWLWVCIIAALSSCTASYDTLSNRDFNAHYTPGQQILHPEFMVFMSSPNNIRLYFRIFPWELTYKTDPTDSVSKAKVQLFFRVTKNYSSIDIIDSLTTQFQFRGNPRPHYLGFVPLNLTEEGNYVMETFLTDLNSGYITQNIIDIHFQPSGNYQSFLMISAFGNPNFKNYFLVTDSFRIRSDMFNPEGIKISYYKPDSLVARPPDFQEEPVFIEPKADTIWICPIPDTTLFHFQKTGLYSFQSTQATTGKTFVATDAFYPYLKTPESLLRPLKYLCSDKEMEGFWELNAPKLAVDSFWISIAGDLDKARELLRVYYNRVQLANFFFTNVKEGWSTDKGMIYIICGPPAKVNFTNGGEYWVYGKGKKEAVEFYFYNQYHPVFGKISILERTDLYARMWFTAIATWREGRIFSLNP